MAPRSIFDPAPTSLPIRTIAGIVLLLVAGTAVTVWGYLDSTESADQALLEGDPGAPAGAPLELFPGPSFEAEPLPAPSAPSADGGSSTRADLGVTAGDSQAGRGREGRTAYGSPRAAVRPLQGSSTVPAPMLPAPMLPAPILPAPILPATGSSISSLAPGAASRPGAADGDFPAAPEPSRGEPAPATFSAPVPSAGG